MGLNVSTPYKSGTVTSATGNTITDSSAAFTSAVVGRYFRIKTSVSVRGGQIRKITAQTSTTLTFEYAWFSALPSTDPNYEAVPVSGDAYVISYYWSDIADGSNVVAVSTQQYNIVSNLSLVSDVFVAQESITLNFTSVDSNPFYISSDAALQCGGRRSDYSPYGGCLIYFNLPTSGGTISVIDSGTSGGDLIFYGCLISLITPNNAQPFFRCYRGATQIARLTYCIIQGNWGGRLEGTRSFVQNCNFYNDQSSLGTVSIAAPFGGVSNTNIYDSSQGFYWNWGLSQSATISGLSFRRIASAVIATTNASSALYTLVIINSYWDNTGSFIFNNSANINNVIVWGYTLTVKAYLGSALSSGGKLAVLDKNNSLVTSEISGDGNYTQITLIQRTIATASTGSQLYSYGTTNTPYTVLFRQYGYLLDSQSYPEVDYTQQSVLSGFSFNFYKQIDTAITSNKTTVDALSGFVYASGSTLLTLSASRSIQDIYNRSISYLVDNPTISAFVAYDKATLSFGWNLTIASGGAVTGTQKLAIGDGKTLTIATAGTYSFAATIPATGVVVVASGATSLANFESVTGATINVSSGTATVTLNALEYTKYLGGTGFVAGAGVTIVAPPLFLALINLQTGSVVYLLNANHQPLEAATASGSTYTFTTSLVNGTNYYYGVQKPGYLPLEQPVTGTSVSQSLTVSQSADPFYNSSYTALAGVTITDNGASPASQGGKSFGITIDAGGNAPIQLYSFLSFKFAATTTYQGKPAYLWRRMLTTIDNQNFETARGDYYSSGGTLTNKGVQVVNYDYSSAAIVLDQMQSDDGSYLNFCKFVITGLQTGSNVGLLSSGSVIQSATASSGTIVLAPFFFSASASYAVNIGLYGYLRAAAATSSAVGIVLVPIAQVVDAFKVSTTPSSITAFTFNDGSTLITQTANASLQDLYDASQYNYSLLANIAKTPAISTVDSVTRSLIYDFTINTGVTLSGSGALSLPAKTFTATGTAYTAIPVTSSAGLRFRVYGLPTVSGANPVLRVKRISNSVITNPTVSTTGEAFVVLVVGEDYQLRADAIGYGASGFITINSSSAASLQIPLLRVVETDGTAAYGKGITAIKNAIAFNPSTFVIGITNASSTTLVLDNHSVLDAIEELTVANPIFLEFTALPYYRDGEIVFPLDSVSGLPNPVKIQAATGNVGKFKLAFQIEDQGQPSPERLFDFANGGFFYYTQVNLAQGGSSGSGLTAQQFVDAIATLTPTSIVAGSTHAEVQQAKNIAAANL